MQVPNTNPPSCAGIAGGEAARLDFSNLGPAIRELFNAGLAQATLRSYKSGCDKYVRVCKEVGVNPFPATEESASLFVAALYRKGLAGGSVKSYLAAVRFSQIALGLGDPKMAEWPRLSYIVRGFNKKAGGGGGGAQEETALSNHSCSVTETEEGVGRDGGFV